MTHYAADVAVPRDSARGQSGSGTGRIDCFDRELIAYVLSWLPYGGPPGDEVFARFGIASNTLPQRICAIIRSNRERALNNEDRVLLLRALAAVRSGRIVSSVSGNGGAPAQ